jgi:CheY-like chemotaxis protein
MIEHDDADPETSTHNFHSEQEFPTAHGHAHHFPGILSDEARRNLRSGAGSSTQARPRRVLVVDDEKMIANTLVIILRKAGYETAVAYDGLAAVEACERFQPDMVISDVVMPRMNGVEAAMQIKQRFPACKILLFSGQAVTTDFLEDARRNGYDFEVLAKPIHPRELLSKLAA